MKFFSFKKPSEIFSFHNITAQQIMTKNVRHIAKNSTFNGLQQLLLAMPKIKAFPIVEDKGVLRIFF